MLEKMLKKCFDEDKTALQSTERIKTAVLSQIKEEKTMKHFSVKPLLIAAAITATAAASVVTANAATDGALADEFVKTFKFFVNGREVEATVTEYAVGDDGKAERISLELPEDAFDENASVIVLESDDEGMTILSGDQVVYGPCGDDEGMTILSDDQVVYGPRGETEIDRDVSE